MAVHVQDTRPNKTHRKHTPVEHTNALKSELNRNQDAMNICETYRKCCCWLKFGHIFDAPMRDSKFQVHRSSVMCFCDKSFVILICAIVVYVHILEFQQRDFSVWNFIRTLFLFDFEIETYIFARFFVCRLCEYIQNWMSNLCSSQVIIRISANISFCKRNFRSEIYHIQSALLCQILCFSKINTIYFENEIL